MTSTEREIKYLVSWEDFNHLRHLRYPGHTVEHQVITNAYFDSGWELMRAGNTLRITTKNGHVPEAHLKLKAESRSSFYRIMIEQKEKLHGLAPSEVLHVERIGRESGLPFIKFLDEVFGIEEVEKVAHAFINRFKVKVAEGITLDVDAVVCPMSSPQVFYEVEFECDDEELLRVGERYIRSIPSAQLSVLSKYERMARPLFIEYAKSKYLLCNSDVLN